MVLNCDSHVDAVNSQRLSCHAMRSGPATRDNMVRYSPIALRAGAFDCRRQWLVMLVTSSGITAVGFAAVRSPKTTLNRGSSSGIGVSSHAKAGFFHIGPEPALVAAVAVALAALSLIGVALLCTFRRHELRRRPAQPGDLEIPPDNISVGELLGSGTFYDVFAAAVSQRSGMKRMDVVVKRCRPDARPELAQRLSAEADIMRAFAGSGHLNLLCLVGTCVTTKPCMIVLERADWYVAVILSVHTHLCRGAPSLYGRVCLYLCLSAAPTGDATRIRARAHLCPTRIRMHTCTCLHTLAHTYMYIHAHTCTHRPAHANTHMHMHMHMHT